MDPVFPDDYDSQMIKADWLEEQGRTPEAQALRTQQRCRQVLMDLGTGKLDQFLGDLERMTALRRDAIFSIGATVRLSNRVTPAYLRGRTGVVYFQSKLACGVQLPQPIGRFHNGRVWVKYSSLVPVPV